MSIILKKGIMLTWTKVHAARCLTFDVYYLCIGYGKRPNDNKNYSMLLNSSFFRKQSILTSTKVQAATQGTRKFVVRYLENKQSFNLKLRALSDIGSGSAFLGQDPTNFEQKNISGFQGQTNADRSNRIRLRRVIRSNVPIIPEVVQLCRAPEQDGKDYCGNQFYT